MTKEKTTLSLKRSILLMFIISLFISVACYGALIFTNWVSSAKKTTAHMAADINDEIYNRIDTFMRVPYHSLVLRSEEPILKTRWTSAIRFDEKRAKK